MSECGRNIQLLSFTGREVTIRCRHFAPAGNATCECCSSNPSPDGSCSGQLGKRPYETKEDWQTRLNELEINE